MKPTKLMGLVAIGMMLPSTLIASSISVNASTVQVKTSNLEATTHSDGSVYVNSGGTSVKVPSRRSYRYWSPWRSWRFPWQSYRSVPSNCHQSSYQSTSHVTRSSNRIVQHSVSSSHKCN
ncbi:hypothetical protein [Pleurocapsa sp. PCC 7319]|uniref:hypothetical protein n=1 Tax=Pleurocapsa sp. PCC 7319 TaxID=118161 RepID=UPI00034A1970|nr:hypothetical protein [Pleurocapsa sp. PCC 7319]